MMITPDEEAELASLEAAFEQAGGRGVELAERIDELRTKRDGDVRGCSCGMADYGAPGHDGHEPEIYVVHSHMHDHHGNGGGGFDWFPVEKWEDATDAYRAETNLADDNRLLEVQLFLTKRPEGLTDEELTEWVFTKYEMGSKDLPVETPIAHFMKGSWEEESDA